MHLINTELLDEISLQAQHSPRLRMNYNLHTSMDAKAQRLLNALEIGTILPIHRHPHTAETYCLLRGKIRVMFYDDEQQMTESTIVSPADGRFGVHIPENQWHTLEVLEPGSVLLEVKDGPYTPLTEIDIMK